MNEDAVKALNEENKHRTSHPFWVWESIQEIPGLLDQCLECEVTSQIDKIVNICLKKEINKIYLLGRGSSYFLTLANRFLFEELTSIPTFCQVMNVFESYPPLHKEPHSIAFIHSHSGKSEGDPAIVEKIKQLGIHTVGITDIPGSDLACVVDDCIIGPGGPKVELPATRTFTTAMFRMMQFTVSFAEALGNKEGAKKYQIALQRLPSQLKEFISAYEPDAKNDVNKMKDCSSFLFIGFGPNLATTEEGAMAFSQSACVPSQSYELENFIHGPMQALSKGRGVISIAPKGPLQSRMLRMIAAAKIIGAKTVVLVPKGTEDLPDVDVQISLPEDIPDLLSPIAYMVPLWQMGYYFGLLGRGGHPDRLSMDIPAFKEAFSFLMKKDKWVSKT
jgi:glucosamine 6-phosphate synthetase-like amidotransferase/phosphosugar isomerase protein